MRQKAILALVLMFALCNTIMAQDAAFKAEATRTIELTHVKEITISTMRDQYSQMAQSGLFNVDDIDALTNEIGDVIEPKQKEFLLKFYSENYTIAELKELNAFLASPTGQKGIRLATQQATQAMSIFQDPEILAKINDIVLKHLKK